MSADEPLNDRRISDDPRDENRPQTTPEGPVEPRAAGDYPVGYGRPPEKYRFKPGQSGNPRGRRKAAATVSEMFDEEFAKRVAVTDERGRKSWISLERATIRALVRRAIRDNRALVLALELRERFRNSDARHLDRVSLSAEDAALLDEILEDRARDRARRGPDAVG